MSLNQWNTLLPRADTLHSTTASTYNTLLRAFTYYKRWRGYLRVTLIAPAERPSQSSAWSMVLTKLG